ncbi:hypothetical protein [Ulvibacter litoralis]|uniref:Uncharacterized protein n=1 Tax=Ulvibacter litoralis TaxID=227084 RepID=A0A1G7JY86_9FLAO|nr:hypothetical protein [Ulvibacter litoralis]GHC65191.1 hypothetical protein GCM10008083_33060 [Ulvibacter litoralis]SDF29937.1 hypothetical protein SAMN05421855_1372 [Ulvibacter litoralis]
MPLLLYSALLLLIVLLINFFVDKKRNCGFKILAIFGIIIGLTSLGLNHLFDNAFGASTPVKIRTENLTNKNLKIYAITFWDNEWNGKGNFVYYDTKLKPNGKSDFWIDNDSYNFWLVAKNENNGIEYLNIVTGIQNEFDFKIAKNEIDESKNAGIAKQLTNETDKNEQIESFAVWANIILIGLVILSLIKRKTGGNNV